MKNLLIIAHGSRREESNAEIRLLGKKVADSMPFFIDDVAVAFLELSSPTIGEAIDTCFNKGVEELFILPYFLSAGNHVAKDIPHEIDIARTSWKDRKITTLPHIGESNEMVKLIDRTFKKFQDSQKLIDRPTTYFFKGLPTKSW
ncbi:CbiX/SirB N-terminal domain-containing protein [Neptuniibacter pectenicola]|uniref:CbiX/SirB N-terminal domain-containing protein n=1 Tax=Neptuniibacter pectenicola TaxID=1806669 RepID=A0ABU9TTH3_9GAMM